MDNPENIIYSFNNQNLLKPLICVDFMEVYAVSGKGGVGKTTVSGALSLVNTKYEKTLWVDCDKQGKAITRTISPEGKIKIPEKYGEIFQTNTPNLFGGAILNYEFKSLSRADSKEAISSGINRDKQFKEYIKQFKGIYGIGAYNDMMSTFFGVNSNPDQALDFAILSDIILNAKNTGIEKIFLDLEPTRGTSRLIKNSEQTARALKNMSKYGLPILTMIGFKYPDIQRFLKGDYIKNADINGKIMMETVQTILDSKFILVCGPEVSKVDEMLYDTQKVVKSFGGKIDSYVINDIRTHNTLKEIASQNRQIERVIEEGKKNHVPIIKIGHYPELCIDNTKDKSRIETLTKIGCSLNY